MSTSLPQADRIVRQLSCSLLCVLSLSFLARAQSTESHEPSTAVQLPADQKALKAAQAAADPAQKLTMLRKFLQDYPDSKRIAAAHSDLFKVLLSSFPERKQEIHQEASYEITHAGKLYAKAQAENNVGYMMAETKPNGVDLKSAEKWLQDALRIDSESEITRYLQTMTAASKEKPMEPAAIHKFFLNDHANLLQSLADIYFHEGKLAKATETLNSADATLPHLGSVSETRGMIALVEHHQEEALKDLEFASVAGDLTSNGKTTLMQLYREAHGGSDKDFNPDMDAAYKQAFPETAPPPHPPIAAGHTVLVELFTGSGCGPCVGADLAVDRMLMGYTAKEVVVLEYDMHIPLPDPLSNPDGHARAAYYGVQYTPWAMVDGTQITVGGGRQDADAQYQDLAKDVDTELPSDFGLSIDLKAHTNAAGLVTANASVSITHPEKIAATLMARAKANEAKVDAAKKVAEEVRASKIARGIAERNIPIASPAPPSDNPRLQMNLALVQDEVRYAGENGIRFHHKVVRAIAKPSDAAFPIDLGQPAAVDVAFDTVAISKSLSQYLDEFSKKNERFGPIKFLSTDTTIPLNGLKVVAWVESPSTHQVLDAAIVPVQAEVTAALR